MSIYSQQQMKQKNLQSTEPQTIEEILDGLYINPKLAEVEKFLAAETDAAGNYVPIKVAVRVVSQTRARMLFSTFRRASVTDSMALANISFDEAEDKYPHLFTYV